MLRAASHFDSMNSAGSIIVLVAYPQAQSLGLRAVDVAQESFMERLTQDEKQVHQELFWPFVLDYRFTGPHPRLVLDHPWERGDACVEGVNTALSHKLRPELSDELLGPQLTNRFTPQPVDHLAVHLRQRHAAAVRPRGKKAGAPARAGAAPAAAATPG